LIRVYIDTRSAVTRAGLEAVLGEHGDIEVAPSPAEADVLLREDLERSEGVPAILLTDEVPLQDALRAGARAVLPRNAAPLQIVAAIHAVAAGLIAVPAEEAAALATPAGDPPEPLTPREMDVLEMLAEGVSNKIIAHRLSISEHTAKFHVNSILAKLRAGTRTEAVMRGLRLGLVKL